MKSTIKSTAIYLMSIKGSTSTLEVKNEIHRQKNNPNFVLYQHEVSRAMKELAQEEGWTGNFNGTYFEYSLPAAAIPTVMPAISTSSSGISSPTPTAGPTTNQVTPVNPLTATYSSVNSAHSYVGYISGNPNFYATGVDKNDVRRKIFLIATSGYNLNITYDDINFCTADYFFNKYH